MKTTIINKILLVLMLITAQQVSALEFQVDGIYYRTSIFTKNSAYVTHSGTSYTESVEYQGEVVIPESVTYNGKTYTIASIGGYAFAGCPGLTSVTIPNTVTTINQNAFNGCTGLKTIECKATTPPALGDNAFTSYDATLVVPSSSESAYKSAAGWSNFKFKEEPSETPGSGENSGEDSGSDNGSDSGSDSGSDNGGDSGSSTVPEACYLVGNYNGWYTPTEENVDELYTLTDPDKDGVYYGKFYFDKGQFSFKIFITIGAWESGNYFGTDRGITMDNITGFLSVSYEGSAYNFECSDWNGGYVEIFFDFKNNTIRFTIPNENNTLVYKITSSTDVEVIAGTEKYSGDIVIPSQVTISGKTFNVTSIGDGAFYNCSGLASVTIGNSVTSIGVGAFYNCSGLASVTIGNSVTSIGDYVFFGCTSLASIAVEPGNTKYDSRDNCNAIIETASNTLIAGCKNTIIPNSVTSIGEYAFSSCTGLISITIPNSVTSIGKSTFYNCIGLTSITIPDSVTSIGQDAFCGCAGLTSVAIPNSVTSIGQDAFCGCAGLTSVAIPNSVTSIGKKAFYNCSGLASVTIGNSVTSIGDYVFSGCNGLTSIVVESGNTVYDSRNNCNAIIETSTNTLIAGCKNTIIPNSVTSIGDFAFYRCSGLTSITIPNSVTSIGDNAFAYSSGLTSIIVESGNTVYDSRNNCNAIIETSTNTLIAGCKNTIIPNSVTSIGDFAFYGYIGLTSITIPDGVTSIGSHAFYDCDGLTSVTIPNSVTSIGDFAFALCTGLTSVIIGSSVTSIGQDAFLYCSGLTSITIPNSVTSIGDGAFYDCNGLTSVTIGNSVTSIGESAFSGCSGLTSIIVESGNTVYDSRDNCNAIIKTSTNTLITGCKNTVIPNSVISIRDNAFSGCRGLTNITIPNSVTSIGNYAFSGCSGLISVTSLNPIPPTCGTDVFYNVSVGNITLEVPAESVSMYQSADTWKDFGTITAVSSASRSESSGIDDILADGDEVEYYNLQGVRVMNPEKGIYIKRQGGKTSKVVL